MYDCSLYDYDITTLKVMGIDEHKKIKLITMNAIKKSGMDIEINDKQLEYVEKNSVNDEKLKNNITRAKRNIYELAFCNQWDYFVTLTLNKELYNREDLDKYHKDLTQFFRDYKKKYGCKIDFLLIPELHKDRKSWHIHGLIKGIPQDKLKQFKVGDKMGKGIAIKVKMGDVVYNWQDYQNKFGFCDLEPIKNHEAVAKYITKYITKDLGNTVDELGAHLYYHSRNLNKAVQIKKGTMLIYIEPDYVGEYCKIKELPYSDELLNYLSSNIITENIDVYHKKTDILMKNI